MHAHLLLPRALQLTIAPFASSAMGSYLLPVGAQDAQAMQGEMDGVGGPSHQEDGLVKGGG